MFCITTPPPRHCRGGGWNEFLLFRNVSDSAVNGVIAGVVIPVTSFADLIPLCHCALKSNICQARAIGERPPPDARDAVRDGDTRQARATGERIIADARHAVRNRDARQARTVLERRIPDARDTVADGNTCQASAPEKRMPPDARDGDTVYLMRNNEISLRFGKIG